ncbi:MAG: hypothetical protein EAZ55_00585 [Cytophagales bacterium]|nr:MAG: hypothetical protein EAZ55_00585 [Cytophagales bacterium]
MLLKIKIFVFVFGFFGIFYPINAQKKETVVQIEATEGEVLDLEKSTYLLELDPSEDTLNITSITQWGKKLPFRPYSDFKGKFSPEKVYWVQLSMVSKISTMSDWYFFVEGRDSYIDLYVYDILHKKFHLLKGGIFRPLSEKQIQEGIYNIFKLHIPVQEPIKLYMRIKNMHKRAPAMRFRLVEPTQQMHWIEQSRLIQGIFQGLVWIMIIYNFFIYYTSRDQTYIYYSLYMFCIAVYFLYFEGLIINFLISETPEWNDVFWLISVNGQSVFYIIFVIYFVNLKSRYPTFYRILVYWLGLRAVILVVEMYIRFFNNDFPLTNTLTFASIGVESLMVMFFSFYFIFKGNAIDRFCAAGILGLIGFIVLGLTFYSASRIMFALTYQSGYVVEIIIFSMGLGYRIQMNERERERTREEFIRLQTNQNKELEEKVKERTTEIAAIAEDLRQGNKLMERQRNEIAVTLKAVEKQKNIIERKNEDIMESLLYAQRIQSVMLPPAEDIEKILPEYFVLYKPRDIVSGDFYFIQEIEQKIFIAVADCTGHGVPGAFMSMLGNEMMHEIINYRKIHSPDLILQALHNGIRKTLRQSDKIQHNQDGMEVAFLVIDKKDNTVEFAGAKKPLIYIINDELHYIRGTKQAIGGEQYEKERSYTKHTIQLSGNTHFYLFSDGYQDQFGGKHNKKFMITRFRSLLREIHQETLEKQYHILHKTLENWMEQNTQTDDILVLGFRYTNQTFLPS